MRVYGLAAAQTLAKASPSTVAGLLDGRDVGELTALCQQLAEQSERVATARSDIVTSTPGGAS